jgi:hypothetical protein
MMGLSMLLKSSNPGGIYGATPCPCVNAGTAISVDCPLVIYGHIALVIFKIEGFPFLFPCAADTNSLFEVRVVKVLKGMIGMQGKGSFLASVIGT